MMRASLPAMVHADRWDSILATVSNALGVLDAISYLFLYEDQMITPELFDGSIESASAIRALDVNGIVRWMHDAPEPGDAGRAAPDLPQLTAVAPGSIGAWAESLSARVGQLAALSPAGAERAIDSAAPDLDADGRAWLLDMAARLRRLASRPRLSPLSAGPPFG